MYRLKLSRREKKELALTKWLLIALAIIGLFVVVWLAWLRPAQQAASINSFAVCKSAGNPIQESYPEVCLTKDGKRFVNPEQDAAHQESLKGTQELTPPTDPSLLYLDIKEWNVRVPLTNNTFDLTYTYLQNGLEDHIEFAYKRLINASLCTSGIGLTLNHSVTQFKPPYGPNNPAPIAHVGDYYYYLAPAGEPCYDVSKADQVALVKKIAGDQSLTQATAALMTKLQQLPSQ